MANCAAYTYSNFSCEDFHKILSIYVTLTLDAAAYTKVIKF